MTIEIEKTAYYLYVLKQPVILEPDVSSMADNFDCCVAHTSKTRLKMHDFMPF